MHVKNGKMTLGIKDTRIGNFILSDLREYWQAQDINRRFSVKVHKDTIAGRILSLAANAKDKDQERYLGNWIVTMFNATLCVHDGESLAGIIEACRGAAERHPELYGRPNADASDKEDAKILKEEKETAEAISKLEGLEDADKESAD